MLKTKRIALTAAILLISTGPQCAGDSSAVVELAGTDFKGGAVNNIGPIWAGELEVNTIYARPTGVHSSMRASFRLNEIPGEPLFLHIKGRDDNSSKKCAIAVEINERVIFGTERFFVGGVGSPEVFHSRWCAESGR